MSEPMVVAYCGRDSSGEVLEEGKHLAKAVWLDNEQDGTGWFIPKYCYPCWLKHVEELQDPAMRAKIDAYLTGPEFQKITDDLAGYQAFRRIMDLQ